MCAEIVEAALNGVWLVLMFHELVEQPPGDYEYGISDFRRILACAKRLQDQELIRVVTVADAINLLSEN